MLPMPRPLLAVIAAVARNRAIGKNNALLLHLPDDLPRFKRLTLGCPIIMGRRTWDSIGRALPGRRNIVLTRDPGWHAAGAETAPSLQGALDLVADAPKVFVIGGGQVWTDALPFADELHLTEIDADLDGDAFFPQWNRSEFEETSREPRAGTAGPSYSFVSYVRKRRA
jgi:dihydrofolate reductase